ncbi:Smr domain containing protein [Russula decolorans]
MARAFEESHAAYARKDGAGAKELSNEGKAHQKEMDRLNAEASAWIFRENNRGRMPGEVDLHGLFVKESIAYTAQSIAEARARGDKEIRLIVGKGIHSPNQAAKLKPAIEELMQKHNLSAAIDPQNSGVLIVQLEGGTAADQVRDRGGVILGADDITQRLDRKDEGCIIM